MQNTVKFEVSLISGLYTEDGTDINCFIKVYFFCFCWKKTIKPCFHSIATSYMVANLCINCKIETLWSLFAVCIFNNFNSVIR